MNELDRKVREQVAAGRAAEAASKGAAKRREADDRSELARDIRRLLAEVIALLEERGFPDVEPIVVRRYRFPPTGNLFGDFTSIKGGWRLGNYGQQELSLLSTGQICWEGRVTRLSDMEHCAPLIRTNLSKLRDRLVNGDEEDGDWNPLGFTIG